MNSKKPVFEAFTISSASLLALSAASAWGQTPSPAGDATAQTQSTQTTTTPSKVKRKADAARDYDGDMQEVLVTGTRIRQPAAESPTPMQVLDSEMIEKSGNRQIADLVNQQPALVISQSDQTSNANRDKDSFDQSHPGLNALDLRGLGAKRTLVLVNGRRHVPGAPGTSAVDISTIPSGLVDRIEIITGGASALYGADAVAGVANFILKKDYQGANASVRYGNSSRSDMPSYDADFLYGKNFAEDRGNFTLYGYYGKSNGTVSGQDRPWTGTGNPWWREIDGVNYSIDHRRNISYSPRAQVLLGGNPYTFNDDGTMRAPVLGPSGILPNTYDMTDSGTIANLETDGGEYGARYDGWLLSVPNDRSIVHGTFGYQLTDNVRAAVELDYAGNKSHGEYGLWWEAGGNRLDPANPFITDAMRAANGGDITDPLAFDRQFPEFGNAESLYKRDFYQAVTSLDGELPDFMFGKDWSWSAYYSYGKTTETIRDVNNIANPRFVRALDVVEGPNGTPICRVQLDDPSDPCVPLNPFKAIGSDVYDYLRYDTDASKSSLQQHVISAYMTGGLFALPPGDVKIAAGLEWRKEINDIGARPQYNPDSPKFVEDYDFIEHPLHGEFTVKEVFAEVRVPVLDKVPGAHALSLDAAVRASDYSTAGRTNSYKYGLQWAPVQDVRFRGTVGQAVRAPNISEVFTASSISGQWLSDPCNYWNRPNRVDKSQFLDANCDQVAPANVNDYWLWLDVNKQGNPDLKVETARTKTVGLVFQPRFAESLVFSVDLYEIDMSNVVSSVEPQKILDKCMDGETLDNSYCALVQRDPTTHNLVSVIKQNINLAKRNNRGVDLSLDYAFNLSSIGLGENSGRFSISTVYTHLLRNDYTADPENPDVVTHAIDIFGFPKWKGVTRLTYQNGPLWLGGSLRHYSPMRQTTTITCEEYSPCRTPTVFYGDVYGSYKFGDHTELGFGVDNVADKAPPRYPGAEAGGAYFGDEGWQSGVFDVIGRTGYLNVRFTW